MATGKHPSPGPELRVREWGRCSRRPWGQVRPALLLPGLSFQSVPRAPTSGSGWPEQPGEDWADRAAARASQRPAASGSAAPSLCTSVSASSGLSITASAFPSPPGHARQSLPDKTSAGCTVGREKDSGEAGPGAVWIEQVPLPHRHEALQGSHPAGKGELSSERFAVLRGQGPCPGAPALAPKMSRAFAQVPLGGFSQPGPHSPGSWKMVHPRRAAAGGRPPAPSRQEVAPGCTAWVA